MLSPSATRPARLLQAKGTKSRNFKTKKPKHVIAVVLVIMGGLLVLIWLRFITTDAAAAELLGYEEPTMMDVRGVFQAAGQQQPTNGQALDGRRLSVFVPPPPPVVTDPAYLTLAQVNEYAGNATLGSYRYQETEACQAVTSNCQLHFPFLDLVNSGDNIDKDNYNNLPVDLAVLTMKGNKAMGDPMANPANQDRVMILSPLQVATASLQHDNNNHQHDFLLGLFDGHGTLGHGTSHFASIELPTILLPKLATLAGMTSSRVKSAIYDSYLELDKRVPFMPKSGSTAITILRVGSVVYIGSTGDSHAFLARARTRSGNNNMQVTILKSTTPHKADMPEESNRILKAGGQIMPKMWNSPTSRVIIPIQTDDNGKPFLVPMSQALAMSRSLGDEEGKKLGYLIPDPNVDVIDLKIVQQQQQTNDPGIVDHYFVVAASDGLWDKIVPQAVASIVAQSFYNGNPSQPLLACQELIQEAARWWDNTPGLAYRDDISIAVKRLDL